MLYRLPEYIQIEHYSDSFYKDLLPLPERSLFPLMNSYYTEVTRIPPISNGYVFPPTNHSLNYQPLFSKLLSPNLTKVHFYTKKKKKKI